MVLAEAGEGEGRRRTGDGPGPLLRIRNMVKRREGGDRVFQIRLPALDLNAGSFLALVGPSGSGKSTLLDMLGLVLAPSRVEAFDLRLPRIDKRVQEDTAVDLAKLTRSGEIDDRAAAVRRTAMGYVLQSGGLFSFLNVGENIDLPRRLVGQKVSRDATSREMRQFGLNWGYEKQVSELSGGERQRVAILRALAHRPSLVLADEPTAAVDRNRAREVVATLQNHARERGAAVIMVTHDLSLVDGVADAWVRLEPDTGLSGDVSGYVATSKSDVRR
jgi:putative ABC transport system ATP-binding protein